MAKEETTCADTTIVNAPEAIVAKPVSEASASTTPLTDSLASDAPDSPIAETSVARTMAAKMSVAMVSVAVLKTPIISETLGVEEMSNPEALIVMSPIPGTVGIREALVDEVSLDTAVAVFSCTPGTEKLVGEGMISLVEETQEEPVVEELVAGSSVTEMVKENTSVENASVGTMSDRKVRAAEELVTDTVPTRQLVLDACPSPMTPFGKSQAGDTCPTKTSVSKKARVSKRPGAKKNKNEAKQANTKTMLDYMLTSTGKKSLQLETVAVADRDVGKSETSVVSSSDTGEVIDDVPAVVTNDVTTAIFEANNVRMKDGIKRMFTFDQREFYFIMILKV